jgi:hypothetical protein
MPTSANQTIHISGIRDRRPEGRRATEIERVSAETDFQYCDVHKSGSAGPLEISGGGRAVGRANDFNGLA